MRSERLPGKVLLPILGRPNLELMIERLRRVPSIDEIVVATSDDESCNPIVEVAGRVEVVVYRGSETDVLDRVLSAARQARADIIVETTGDCPLIDPETIERVIAAFLTNDVDYCSNILERTYPRGMDTQVFPLSVLEEVARSTTDAVDREHVSLYICEHPERFRLMNVVSHLGSEVAQLRLTVDTPEDFDLIRRIYEELYPRNPTFGLSDILDLLERRPELREINRDIEQKKVR